jgi:2'-5' RNA ligase
MHGVKYDYSSVQINLPDHLANKIVEWGKKIPDNDIFRDPNNPSFGREDEIHVTVLYGIHSKSPRETKSILHNVHPFTVELKNVSLFSDKEKPFDVVKIGVESPDLHKLNTKLKNELDYTSNYNEYIPHVTIAYVKKGKGWKFNGDKSFDGKLFMAEEILFSPRNGSKTKIALH